MNEVHNELWMYEQIIYFSISIHFLLNVVEVVVVVVDMDDDDTDDAAG